MANEIKYLSYEGLEYFWKNKLKPEIEANEEVVAASLVDLDDRLSTHTHSYAASAGYVATAANAVTAGRALYSGSAGYSASAARAGYAAYAGYVSNSLIIQGNGTSLGRYNGSGSDPVTINITADSIGAASSTHTHTYVASAGYSASAARATYSASAGYVSGVNIQTSNSTSYLPMVFTNVITATVGAKLYIDSATSTSSTATGIRYSPYYNRCYCSGGFYEASDERLKNFGDDIEVDLDKLSTLSKKYFTWKDDESNTQHIGVSAQEVQAIYPELVEVIDEDGHLSVSYDKLSVVALKGIDVLNDKIKSLEKRLERFEKLIKV